MSARRFKPRWWAWLLLVAGVLLALRLGWWQWSKAEHKAEQRAQLSRMQQSPALNVAAMLQRPPQPWQPVQLEGIWQPQGAVWLDNRVQNGIAGYELWMPLQLAGEPRWLLVNRGWVSRAGKERVPLSVLGQIGKVRGEVVWPGPLPMELSKDVQQGKLWQNLTPQRYQQHYQQPVLPWLVRQTGSPEAGLSHDWPEVDDGRMRNVSYAGQWLLIALLMVVLFVVVNLKKQEA